MCLVFGLSDDGCGLLNTDDAAFGIVLKLIILALSLSIGIHTLLVVQKLPCYSDKVKDMITVLYSIAFSIASIVGLYLLSQFARTTTKEFIEVDVSSQVDKK